MRELFKDPDPISNMLTGLYETDDALTLPGGTVLQVAHRDNMYGREDAFCAELMPPEREVGVSRLLRLVGVQQVNDESVFVSAATFGIFPGYAELHETIGPQIMGGGPFRELFIDYPRAAVIRRVIRKIYEYDSIEFADELEGRDFDVVGLIESALDASTANISIQDGRRNRPFCQRSMYS